MVVHQSSYEGGHKSLTRPNFQKNFIYLCIYVCVYKYIQIILHFKNISI